MTQELEVDVRLSRKFHFTEENFKEFRKLDWSSRFDKLDEMTFEPSTNKLLTFFSYLFGISFLLLFIFLTIQSLNFAIPFKNYPNLNIRNELREGGIFVFLYLYAGILAILTTLLSLIVIALGIFFIALIEDPNENGESSPTYLAKIAKEAQEEDFFEIIEERRSKQKKIQVSIVIKKVRIYWNPEKIFDSLFGHRAIYSFFIFVGIILTLIGLCFALSIDALDQLINKNDIDFWILDYGTSQYVLGVFSLAVMLIGLFIILFSLWETKGYYIFVREMKDGIDNYIDRMKPKMFSDKVADDISKLDLVYEIKKEIDSISWNPYGFFLKAIPFFLLLNGLITLGIQLLIT